MKIIYRYLLIELITPFLFGVTAFTAIFVGTDVLFRLTEYYHRWGVSLLTLVQLFFLSLPAIIVLTFPMSTLLGIIMAFGRLSSDSEITALRSGGISLNKLIIPALLVGLVMSILTIGINELVVPFSNNRYEEIVWQIRHGEKLPATQSNLFVHGFGRDGLDYILYARHFDGDTGEMTAVILQDYSEGKARTIIEADKAVWQRENWIFYQGQIFHLKAGERIPALSFEEYKAEQFIHTPTQVVRSSKKTSEMNLIEFKERINFLEEQGQDTKKERVEFQQRLAVPFASFIFALLAAPLGIRPQRSSGTATGMGISIIVIFIYYSLMTIGMAMGEQGSLSPFLGAWLQNIIFLIIGGIMLFRMDK